MTPRGTQADEEPWLGVTIGSFRLVSRIGRGGMGEVYRAVHTDIQTEVAIKLLHPEISREVDHVQRFFNEARAVGRVRNAGIVKIFDVGFHDDRAYLMMELLEGESLAQRLGRGRMSATQIADVGRQIASVLDAAHRAGVIHRDLKPDNIFLVDAGLGREHIKVLDFGIAKLCGPVATSSAPRTVGAIGTPAYMAPEQWADASKVTSAADVYSLGCLLFEMGGGRPPFRATTMAEACTSHLHEPPPTMRSIYPDTPPALDAIVQRLLAKKPGERPAMTTLASELFSLGGDVLPLAPTIGAWSQPVGDVAPTTLDLGTGELHRTTRMRRAIAGSLAGVLLVGALVILTAIGSGSGEPVAHPAATPTIRATVPPVAHPAATPTIRATVPPVAPPVPRVTEPAKVVPPELAATAPAPVTPKRLPTRRTKSSTPSAPTPAPSRPVSTFDGVELGSDGIPTKR